jgi:hypothetical protein
MKRVTPSALARMGFALLMGIAAGAGVRYLFATGSETRPHLQGAEKHSLRAQETGGPGAASGWVRELRHLDPADYRPYSRAWLARFCEDARREIAKDPRAAMEAFAASPDLQTSESTGVFAELLSEANPMLTLELSRKLPRVFAEYVRGTALPGLGRLSPVQAVEQVRAGAFGDYGTVPGIYEDVGRGAALNGDITQLPSLRGLLEGEELRSALQGFAAQFARLQPLVAVAAAKENPDIAEVLVSTAVSTLWRQGEVGAALDSLSKCDPASSPARVKELVMAMHMMPPDAYPEALRRLVELNARDAKILPPAVLYTACDAVRYLVSEVNPERLADFAKLVPAGPLRDMFKIHEQAASRGP